MIWISLDQEIFIASRIVKDIVVLLGDIGGFYSLFFTLLGLFVGSIPSKLFSLSTASDLFQANLKKSSKSKKVNDHAMRSDHQLEWFSATKRPELDQGTKFKFILAGWLGKCLKKRKDE